MTTGNARLINVNLCDFFYAIVIRSRDSCTLYNYLFTNFIFESFQKQNFRVFLIFSSVACFDFFGIQLNKPVDMEETLVKKAG